VPEGLELLRFELTYQFTALEHHEPEGGNRILIEKEAFEEEEGIDPATMGEDSDIMNSPDPTSRARRSPSTDSEYRRLWGKF
jgi:hypothetical protein